MKDSDSRTRGWMAVIGDETGSWRESVRAATASCRRWGLKAIDAGIGIGDDVISLAASGWAKRPEVSNVSSVLPHSFVTLDQLERLCREKPIAYLVEGLLPAADVHIAVGDSGLGKT